MRMMDSGIARQKNIIQYEVWDTQSGVNVRDERTATLRYILLRTWIAISNAANQYSVHYCTYVHAYPE